MEPSLTPAAENIHNGSIWQASYMTKYLTQWTPEGKQGDWMLMSFGSSTQTPGQNNFIPYNSRSYSKEGLITLLKSLGAQKVGETVILVPLDA